MPFQQALEAAQAATSFEIPERMKFKFREIKNIFKHQIKFLPSTGQQEVQAGQTIMCELPTNTVVDLASFTMQYVARTTHAGKAGAGAINYIQSRFMPRNSASIIQELTVDINGQSRFSLNDYNLVWNILFDNTAAQDSLYRRSAGSENADPSRKHFKLGDDIMERRGYPIAKNPGAAGVTTDDLKIAYDEQLYIIRSWLGLCSSQATTTIIDTTLLGSVVIKIRLAPPTILCLGQENTEAITAVAANLSEFGIARAAVAANTTVIDAQVANYKLKDIVFSMNRYDLPSEFYKGEMAKLGTGGVFRIFFPNYSVFTGPSVQAGNKKGVSRASVSTKSLDWVIGTFRLPNYTNIEKPLLTLISDANEGERGEGIATFDSQCRNGLRRLFNNSRYFCRNGSSITKCKWEIGSGDYKDRTLEEQFNQLLLHYNIANDQTGGMYPGIQSIHQWQECFYTDLLSLAIENTDPYCVSGLDTKATPVQISWYVDSEAIGPIDTLIPDEEALCTPYIICGYTSCLEIRGGRQITLIL
jgi:hypothetical protein